MAMKVPKPRPVGLAPVPDVPPSPQMLLMAAAQQHAAGRLLSDSPPSLGSPDAAIPPAA